MLSTPYRLPPRIERFFREFVIKPFEEHERSDAWVNEVINRDQDYQTKTIIDRGRTDFTLGWNGLTPRDKILIYCYHYMEMHTVSGFHVFQRGCKDHRLNFLENVVFLDFGCGPLTSAVSLAWHNLMEYPKTEEEGLLVHYLGIERSEAMLAHAHEAFNSCGLFHRNSTFDFMTPARSLEIVPPRIGQYRSALDGKAQTIILNCSYFFASHYLLVGGLISFISGLLKDHVPNDKVCLVFQNPDSDGLNAKWERFKNGMTELRGLSRNSEAIHFSDLLGQERKIRLRFEFLLNRKWMTSGDIIPF
jgi:hypothetical protein